MTATATIAGQLHDAVRNQNSARVKELLDRDRKLANVPNAASLTPLHIAAEVNSTNIARMLLMAGADINARTEEDSTPLHTAAIHNSLDVATLLYDEAANTTLRAAYGFTPVELAVRRRAWKLATAIADEDEKALFADQWFITAHSAQAAKELDRAFTLFSLLLKRYPDSVHVNNAIADTAYQLKKYPHSAAALRRILIDNPDNGRARFELARVHYDQKQLDTARAEFATALKSATHPRVRDKIKGYIDRIDRRTKKASWSLRVGGGALHDGNANVGPSTDMIGIEPTSFHGMAPTNQLPLADSSLAVESMGVLASASAGGLYDIGSPNSWALTASANYYQTWIDVSSDYDILYLGGSAGLRYAAGRHLIDLPAAIKHVDRGGAALVDVYAFTPSWLVALGARGWINVTASGSVEQRSFPSLSDRDGLYTSAAGSVKLWTPQKRYNAQAGVAVYNEDPDADVYRNQAVEYSAAVNAVLPFNSTAYIQAKHKTSNYDGKRPLEPETGKDEQLQVVLGMTKSITDHIGANLNAQMIDNTSTFDLYEYDRWLVMLTTFYTF